MSTPCVMISAMVARICGRACNGTALSAIKRWRAPKAIVTCEHGSVLVHPARSTNNDENRWHTTFAFFVRHPRNTGRSRSSVISSSSAHTKGQRRRMAAIGNCRHELLSKLMPGFARRRETALSDALCYQQEPTSRPKCTLYFADFRISPSRFGRQSLAHQSTERPTPNG